MYTDKKENEIFLIHKEIQMGSVAKSYMRKGFLIYEEMRKYITIYEEGISHRWLCNRSLLSFLIYDENFIFFFISVWYFTLEDNSFPLFFIQYLYSTHNRQRAIKYRRHFFLFKIRPIICKYLLSPKRSTARILKVWWLQPFFLNYWYFNWDIQCVT